MTEGGQPDPVLIFEQWLPMAEMLTGMKNYLISQGWSSAAAESIVVLTFQASTR